MAQRIGDGRHAEVVFTSDWAADAARRDFTMNALYCDAAGKIYDYTNGYADVLARRVRFVGVPSQRIKEDYLRILRFFRFHARFGQGALDEEGLFACKKLRAGIKNLSAERIRVEILKLLEAPAAAATLAIMRDAGILDVIIPCTDDLTIVDRLPCDGILRLLAISSEPFKLKDRLKLSNEEAARISAALNAPRLSPGLRDTERRVILYQIGVATWRDRAALDQAINADDREWVGLAALPDQWLVPKFPLAGQNLLDNGFQPGPEIGRILSQVEDWWLAKNFEPGHDELLARALNLKGKNHG